MEEMCLRERNVSLGKGCLSERLSRSAVQCSADVGGPDWWLSPENIKKTTVVIFQLSKGLEYFFRFTNDL